MESKELTRRAFLERAAALGGVALSASLVMACKPKESAGGEKGGAAGGGDKAAAGCTDVSGLTDAEKATRNSLKYVDKSTDPAKNCGNCSLFVAGEPCGTCSVVKGPIAAAGNCTAWAPKS